MAIDEKKLIQLAKDGKRSAFDALVKSCAHNIYNLAMRLTRGDVSASQDIAQDAFVNAYRNIDKFKGDSTFSNWVYRIAVNTWKNRVRYEKRRLFSKHSSIDEERETEDGIISRDPEDTKLSPEGELDKKDRDEGINKALAELPEKMRVIIVLKDIQEMSYEEIGDILDISQGTVKSRLSRARDTLREIIIKYVVVD